MKDRLRVLLACAVSIACPILSLAQPSFQNLDFEAAHSLPLPDPDGHPVNVPALNAFPGWICYWSSNETSVALFNGVYLDAPALGIQTASSLYVPEGLLNGQYCASLQTGRVGWTGTEWILATVAIAQLGEIPIDAQSIQFNGNEPIVVTFDGNTIPLVVLNSQPNYSVYGGDISQFAGQTGELRFTSLSHFGYLDSIQFSSQSIPEPSTFCLVLLGLVVLCGNFRFVKR
jgi:hypothetical protein